MAKKQTLIENIASANLAEHLNEDTLMEIGSTVISGFEADLQSRADWLRENEEWLKLAIQVREPKDIPWPNASNVKYPLVATTALQFHARAYAGVLPGTQPVRGRVIGYDNTGEKAAKAEKIGKHMSWQLLEEMEEWESDMDRLLLILPLSGCAFKKTYYDPALRRNRSVLVLPQNFVIDYYARTIKDSHRHSEIITLTKNQVLSRQRKGLFLDVDLGTPDQKRVLNSSTSDMINKTQAASHDKAARPFEFVEQHTFLDLDEDGYEEPYVVTVEYNSRTVVRIAARYTEADIEIDPDSNEVLEIKPFVHYTKFSFIPNPDGGFYDLGYGALLGPLNESTNTLVNQLVDSGTLNNLQGGFLAKGIRLSKGNMGFTPGEWKTVNTTMDDLSKGIFPLPTKEPSGVLYQLLGLLLESGQRLASVTDLMMGESPGQNQAATTTLALMEQGLKVFTAIYKRIHNALKQEYSLLYRLNALYLDDNQYFTVLDAGQEKGGAIAREDYDLNGFDVVPYSDPNAVTTSQKLFKVQSLLEIQGALGTLNPTEITKRYLDATEQHGIEALMTLPDPTPDPEIVLKQQELAFKQQMETEKFAWQKTVESMRLDLDRIRNESEGMKDQAVGILSLAKANAEEQNSAIKALALQLEHLRGLFEKGAEASVQDKTEDNQQVT